MATYSKDENRVQSPFVSCRICLGHDNPQSFITPCRCTGSISSVHHDCLVTWIVQRDSELAAPACELCSTLYSLTFKKTRKWVCPKTVTGFLSAMCLIMLGISFIGFLLGFAVFAFGNLQKEPDESYQGINIVLIVLSIFASGALGVVLAMVIRYSFTSQKFKTIKIESFVAQIKDTNPIPTDEAELN